MNYRHIYHAGNFADVVKHITLISLINKLKNKDKPFAVLDAFAGLGIYDLSADQAERTGENKTGINQLYSNLSDDAPELIKQYIEIVRGCASLRGVYDPVAIQQTTDSFAGSPRYARDDDHSNKASIYPGSPLIISSMIRSHDRLIACELHKEDYPTLKHNMALYPNSHIHNIDAYQSIKAFTPMPEKRGLILLDPAFEVRDEFDKILSALKILRQRFASGMVMIWYPIKDQKAINDFYQKQKEVGYNESLIIEFELLADDTLGMNKCGIMICNPPFVETEIKEAMAYLTKEIYHGKAKSKVWMEKASS